jgi:hypothetical protein
MNESYEFYPGFTLCSGTTIIMVSAAFSNRSLSLPLLNHFNKLSIAVAQNKCHPRCKFSFQSLLRVEQLQFKLASSCCTKNNQTPQTLSTSIPYFTSHNTSIAVTNYYVIQKPCFRANYISTNASSGNDGESDAVDQSKKYFIHCKVSIANQLINGEVLDVAVQPGDSVGIIKGMIKKQCSPLLDNFSELEIKLYPTALSKKSLDFETKWSTRVKWGRSKSPLLVKVNKFDLNIKGR